MKMLTAFIAVAVGLAGCSESQRARRSVRQGDLPADIVCRSYGEVLFKGRSTGRVTYDEGGRVSFVDAANGRLTTIEGECLIVYERPRARG